LDLVSAIAVGASGRKHVSKSELKRLIPFMFVGIIFGATVLAGVSETILRTAVGAFALCVGIYAMLNHAMHRVTSPLWCVRASIEPHGGSRVIGAHFGWPSVRSPVLVDVALEE